MDVQQQIKNELINVKKGLSDKNIVQLGTILKEFEKILNNKCLPLSYPRIIVDTWDYHDKLGMELLDLAKLYNRWK